MIIGITGLAGSGKSEVAHVLKETARFRRVAFADPLKGMLASIGFTHEQLYGGEKEVPLAEFGGKTPRHMMQTLGTEWGRHLIVDEIWVTVWKRQVMGLLERAHHVVVDDVRFPNEVEAITSLGGEVWRVERHGVRAMNHPSEVHISSLNVAHTIGNNGGLHDLRQMAHSALASARVRCA